MRVAPTLVLTILLGSATAHATPGPATTVVIANDNVPESVALANRYAEARSVPPGQVCLLDVEDVEDIDLADYEASFLTPLRACLDATPGTRERIEAAVLIRGVPLRVRVPVGGGTQVVSLAATLQLWDSNQGGAPMLGVEPGVSAMCGASACYAPTWTNPYRGFPFEPGWSSERAGVEWRPILVTMLHARTYEDAESLLDSALEAEATTPPTGEMLFMEGRDPARGVLDSQYDRVIMDLGDLGFTATRVPFEADLVGRTLSSFVTGTATIGSTIEGNAFRPGAIVDNLTSFGAVPQNFRETGESQVSIARWVEQGVAGAHGTVAEPLNGCFPNRRFLVEYVLGATLAEAYLSMMPYVYWRNLVLGDPMAAPYAMRPELSLEGVVDGAPLTEPTRVTIGATDPGARGVESLVAYLDGVELARADGDALELCLEAGSGAVDQQLLIVARAADDPMGVRVWKPKGWLALRTRTDGIGACPSPDAGPPPGDDAGVATDAEVGSSDAGTGEPMSEGCACRASSGQGARPTGGLLFACLVALAIVRRRSIV